MLFEILHHGLERLVRHLGHVVRRDAVDLRPAPFRARVTQGELDVCEGLGRLLVEV